MTFPADWSVTKIQGITGVNLETASPIVPNGSLFINATLAPERTVLQNMTYPIGLTAGRMRSILNVTHLTTTGEERVGFTFMQNAASIHGVTDAGYGVFMNGLTGFGSPRISVVKFLTGLPATPIELASTTSFTAPTLGSNFVFEVQWIADIGVYGGTQIIARYFTGTNFSLLVDEITIVDTVSPIITSGFESLALSFAGTGQFRVLWDETRIFEIV